MALRPFLGRIPRVLLHPSRFTMIQSKQQVLPIMSSPACFVHSSQRFEKKKKGPIYVTMALEQEVQVFDLMGEDLGLMTKTAAEELAKSKDFHIILVSDKSKHHPVMRFCSTKEFREKEKNDKHAKKVHAKPKEKRLVLNTKIQERDLNIKVTHAVKLLQKDCQVTVRIKNFVPGKEKEIQVMFQHFADACKGIGTVKKIMQNEDELVFLLKPLHHHDTDSKAPLTNKDLKKNTEK